MSVLMIVLLVITALCSLGLAFGITKNYDGWSIGSGITLVAIVLMGWIVMGSTIATETKYEVIPKNKIEIVTSSDKVFVTEKELNQTSTFEDARVYNAVTIRHDSTFYLQRNYNMYGYEVNIFIVKYK